jgi:hypothetical protein
VDCGANSFELLLSPLIFRGGSSGAELERNLKRVLAISTNNFSHFYLESLFCLTCPFLTTEILEGPFEFFVGLRAKLLFCIFHSEISQLAVCTERNGRPESPDWFLMVKEQTTGRSFLVYRESVIKNSINFATKSLSIGKTFFSTR